MSAIDFDVVPAPTSTAQQSVRYRAKGCTNKRPRQRRCCARGTRGGPSWSWVIGLARKRMLPLPYRVEFRLRASAACSSMPACNVGRAQWARVQWDSKPGLCLGVRKQGVSLSDRAGCGQQTTTALDNFCSSGSAARCIFVPGSPVFVGSGGVLIPRGEQGVSNLARPARLVSPKLYCRPQRRKQLSYAFNAHEDEQYLIPNT